MGATNDCTNLHLSEEAAKWVVRKEGGELGPEAAAAFDAWYQASPQHAQAYQELAGTWQQLNSVTQTSLARRRALRKMPKAALTICALVLGTLMFMQGINKQGVIESGVHIARITLPDGSVATLDAQTRIRVVFEAGQRQVRLESGRALFEVAAKGGDAPAFTVMTTQAQATALGTRYEVSQENGLTGVAVYEHAVNVHCTHCADQADAVLQEGETATISDQILAVSSVTSKHSADKAPTWTHGLLAFDDVGMPQAVQALGRYTHSLLIVVGDKAKAIRVSGVVNATRPAAALALLLAGQAVNVRELPGMIVVY